VNNSPRARQRGVVIVSCLARRADARRTRLMLQLRLPGVLVFFVIARSVYRLERPLFNLRHGPGNGVYHDTGSIELQSGIDSFREKVTD